MSVIRVTKDSVVNVCRCGASTEYKFSDMTITQVAVQFPVCKVCNHHVSGVFANPYTPAWEDLNEEDILRQVIGQIVHKLALEHKDSKTDGTPKEDILRSCSEKGRHFAVPDSFDVFTAEPPVQFKKAVDHFKKTGKPYITVKKDPVHIVPDESKVFKILSGNKE